MATKKQLNELIEKSIQNIEEDRGATNKLLTDLLIYMAKTGDSAHQTVGHVAAQYVETLQRSNEQLVKIAALMQKQESSAKGMSALERDGLFDAIKEEK
jgi:hypothetical protein